MRTAIVPPSWADFYAETHIPAAVRDGQTIRATGHTCETIDHTFAADIGQQIRDTFASIAETLAASGASWADVVEINSYHVGLRDQAELMTEIAGEFLADPYPAWTAVGVTELYDVDALIEISVVAVAPTPGRRRQAVRVVTT